MKNLFLIFNGTAWKFANSLHTIRTEAQMPGLAINRRRPGKHIAFQNGNIFATVRVPDRLIADKIDAGFLGIVGKFLAGPVAIRMAHTRELSEKGKTVRSMAWFVVTLAENAVNAIGFLGHGVDGDSEKKSTL